MSKYTIMFRIENPKQELHMINRYLEQWQTNYNCDIEKEFTTQGLNTSIRVAFKQKSDLTLFVLTWDKTKLTTSEKGLAA